MTEARLPVSSSPFCSVTDSSTGCYNYDITRSAGASAQLGLNYVP